MNKIIAWWKGSAVAVKVVTVIVPVVVSVTAVVLVGQCGTETVSKSEQVLVSGAVVTVVTTPDAPPGVVVVTELTEFGGPQMGGLNALRGLVFYVPDGTSSLVHTNGMGPVAVLYTSRLDIAPRSWKSGFPGVPGGRNEWFQVDYEGKFFTSRGGEHRFETLSDDGSQVFIDGQLVVNNDGRHPPKSAQGAVSLPAGKHSIRVSYFQGPRFEIALQLFVTPPSGARQILDVSRVL